MAKLGAFLEEGKGQNICIYGAPKSGKTALVAELANLGYRVHVLDLESGAGVFGLVVNPENYDNVNIYSIVDNPQEPNAVKTVSHVIAAEKPVTICTTHGKISCIDCVKLYKDAATTPDKFDIIDTSKFNLQDVLLIDSLTQLSGSAIYHSMGTVGIMQTKKAGWDEYGDQGKLLDFILGKAQSTRRFHTIFISHEKELEQEDGSEKLTPVGGTKNYSRSIGRFFDHLIYCQIKNKKHGYISMSTDNAKINTGNRYHLDLADEGITLADFLNPSDELIAQAKERFMESKVTVKKTLTKPTTQSTLASLTRKT